MPDQLQLRGGTTAEHSAFTGASKEVTVDTSKKTVVVHDGTTAGGVPVMREDASNSALALGSQGTPSLKFTGDTNTGIYSPGADQLAISTGGSNRLHITPAGLVGIGTSNVSASLHVAKNTNGSVCSIRISGNDGAGDGGASLLLADNEAVKWSIFTRRYSSNNRLYISTAENDTNSSKVTITEGGSVGIGTTSPAYKLDIFCAQNDGLQIYETSSGNNRRLRITQNAGGVFYDATYSTGLNAHAWGIGSAEVARIDSSGRLLVGTTSSTGSVSNMAPVIAGLFQSFDDVGAFTNGVAQTLFTIPNTDATYIITLRRPTVGDAANYQAVSILSTNATVGGSVSAVLTALKTAGNVSISISGTNLQGTQTTGGSASLRWVVTRVG